LLFEIVDAQKDQGTQGYAAQSRLHLSPQVKEAIQCGYIRLYIEISLPFHMGIVMMPSPIKRRMSVKSSEN
jgi:hypothetical protein